MATAEVPDRLSVNPRSPHYDAAVLGRGVGVRFKGVERTNVAEYCLSEGWVRLIPAGRDYRTSVKLQGPIEVYFRS